METSGKTTRTEIAAVAAAERYFEDVTAKHGKVFANLVMVLDGIKSLADNQKPGAVGLLSTTLAAAAFNELIDTLGQNPQKLVDAAIGLDKALKSSREEAERP